MPGESGAHRQVSYPQRQTSIDENRVSSGSALELNTPLARELGDQIQPWHWLAFALCGLLVMFAVPSMSYSLYKTPLREVLDLSPAQVQDIVSFALFGGGVLGFLPGLIYDSCGYSVTLLVGGFMSASGAFMWYYQLSDGGEPGSPTWYGLGLSYALMSHGCRYHYVGGMCAVLGVFPERLVGTVSGGMAVCCSLGYIILPPIWRFLFLPSRVEHPEAYNKDTHNLATLTPVSGFYLMMGTMYVVITLLGLVIAGKLKQKSRGAAASSTLRQRFRRLSTPLELSQVMLMVGSLGFISAFMTSGVAEAAAHAGASSDEVAAVITYMGMVGLLGRCFHGTMSDWLRSHSPAGKAGQEVMFISALSCSLVGFVIMIYSPGLWRISCFSIAFAFGGLFAILPAAIRTIFPADEVGFWLGSLTSLMGILSWLYGRLAAAAEWDYTVYYAASVGALASIAMFTVVACMRWGSQEPTMKRQVTVQECPESFKLSFVGPM